MGSVTRTSTTGGPARISAPVARRIALAAQGFLDPRPEPGRATTRHLNRVIHRVGVVQIDSVNVLCRSHYLPFFSRLGSYDRALLDRMRDRAPRKLVEYWAHEASLIPPSTWPLLNFRMQRAKDEAWGEVRRVFRERPKLVEAVLEEVRSRGPVTAKALDTALALDLPARDDNWGWNWGAVKTALEYLFWAGEITSAGRTAQFERRYAVPERVLPGMVSAADGDAAAAAAVADDVDDAAGAGVGADTIGSATFESQLELLRISARAHGIGTARCFKDYFRLRGPEADKALGHLVMTGELERVEVPGWRGPVYLDPTARRPRRVHAEALLSPFDSLVWQRERTEFLFGMKYRLEIYTPAAKRVHGYYVLPFLYGDTLVARVDLKADRMAGLLRVHRCTWEPEAPSGAREGLLRQLDLMAAWLELDGVQGRLG